MTNIICRFKEINILAPKTIAFLSSRSSRKIFPKIAIFERKKMTAAQDLIKGRF